MLSQKRRNEKVLLIFVPRNGKMNPDCKASEIGKEEKDEDTHYCFIGDPGYTNHRHGGFVFSGKKDAEKKR
jgi:hypothetical protein